MHVIFLALLTFIHSVLADDSTEILDHDPYLEYKPPFVRSLPVQILLTGIVLALTTVLFIHLIFTAQYHWPLAPVNYALQLSGVTTLLISLIATINVVLKAVFRESNQWPYMISYIAVNVPPLDYIIPIDTDDGWSIAERATWMVMNATTSGLIQITHIQYLTLLYPSRLEARLIFLTLGPMAIVAAIMQLIPIQTNTSVNVVASAIRNVCNATLSLLFTAAVFVWGLLIKREQAWRTDGGTAAFGAAALILALVSTALNFTYIPREEEYVWMPSLMWAVILWQNFLGWWWWVGAGSGNNIESRERVEQMMRKQAKKTLREKRKKEKMEHRRQIRKQTTTSVWQGITDLFGTNTLTLRTNDTTPTDHHQQPNTRITSDGEISDEPHSGPIGSRRSSFDANADSSASRPGGRSAGYASSTISSSGLTSATLPSMVPAFVHRWYARLRVAHTAAARQQAVERVARIRALERAGTVPTHTGSGWGLGSFGLRLNRDCEIPTPHSEMPQPTYELRARQGATAAATRDPKQNEIETISRQRDDVRVLSDDEPDGSQDRVNSENTDHDDSNPSRFSSMWWWGPLRRWRLQDSTQY